MSSATTSSSRITSCGCSSRSSRSWSRDIDLERDREQLKAIRRGEWTLEQLETWAQDKEKQLEAVYHSSEVPYGPDEPLIRTHLVHCLEMHSGDLSSAITTPGESDAVLRKIAALTERYR